MSQVKIYGLRSKLNNIKAELSDVIRHCSLGLPKNKRAHRFINLDRKDFYYPEGRTDAYIIIEIMMITGRKAETKKSLIKKLFEEISNKLNISTTDIEICILESPASNWGFRGIAGDDVSLTYKIEV